MFKKISPFEVSVPNVLEFLTDQFRQGANYGTLNSYRSAIAQLAGPELGLDFRVKRFFKGVFGLKPPLPRYENTWDPNIVLSYVKSLNTKKISLEMLTQKLAVLLALATGHRLQTLSLIEINNILVLPDKVQIKISARIKTSARNKAQPLLILPFYSENKNLCVSETLLQYLNQTSTLRGDCKALFITCKKPHRPASSQTIGRWIKKILEKSGLDTSQFKPQSTRHASTSKAARAGLSFDSIRLAAGWSKNSKAFATFYNRPIVDNQEFAKTVLNDTQKL